MGIHLAVAMIYADGWKWLTMRISLECFHEEKQMDMLDFYIFNRMHAITSPND
jgi:hypothetical protein